MWLRLPRSISASSADVEDSISPSELQCLRLAVSAVWRTMSRSPAFWRLAWKKGALKTLRSGQTLERSRQDSIVTEWLESLGAFPVPIIPLLESGPGSSGSTGNSGKRSEESFATFDPSGSFWRTSLESLFHTASQGGDGILSDENGRGISFLPDSGLYLETWPRSGSMRNGSVSRRPMWERRTRGSGGSVWPTASVPNGGRTSNTSNYRPDGTKQQIDLGALAKGWQTPHGMGNVDAAGKRGGAGGGEFARQANNWPTPNKGDGESGQTVEEWRTPTVCSENSLRGSGQSAAKRLEQGHAVNLQDQVADYSLPAPETPKPGESSLQSVPGLRRRLNPAFTSMLMGLPWWWTRTEPISCAPREMESYLCALRSRLRSFFAE